MTGLALLAHPADPAAPAFNTAFYATIATVIPVLFLTLVVQERVYDDLLRIASRALTQIDAPGTKRQINAAFAVGLAAQLAAVLILGSGVLGEIYALISLYFQRPVGLIPGLPLVEAALLSAAAAAPAALALARYLRSVYMPGAQTTGAQQSAELPGPDAPDQHPGTAESSGAGNPDAG